MVLNLPELQSREYREHHHLQFGASQLLWPIANTLHLYVLATLSDEVNVVYMVGCGGCKFDFGHRIATRIKKQT